MIGNANAPAVFAAAGGTRPGVIPAPVSTPTVPASGVNVVFPPSRMSCAGLASTTAVPRRKPACRAFVPKAAFSALAPDLLRRTATFDTLVPRPGRVILALPRPSLMIGTRSPPTAAESVVPRMRKFRSRTTVPWAERRRPPEWLITPAAVLGSISPPVMGNLTAPLRLNFDGLIGATETPSDPSALAALRARVRRVSPAFLSFTAFPL